MKLLTKEILAVLPPLGGQEEKPDPIVYVKFFTPDGSFTWYATEGEAQGDDFMFFGYVIGLESEWGYFRLSDLQSVRGHLNLSVERDLYFEPTPVSTFRRGEREE
jgi:Protein of unknown function (DUF2958)